MLINRLILTFQKLTVPISTASKLQHKDYHVLHDNTSFKAEVIHSNFNKKSIQVKVNNNTYNVNIFNELDILIKDMGFEIGSSKLVNEIMAPMPGLYIRN